jgi:hypothetical protein
VASLVDGSYSQTRTSPPRCDTVVALDSTQASLASFVGVGVQVHCSETVTESGTDSEATVVLGSSVVGAAEPLEGFDEAGISVSDVLLCKSGVVRGVLEECSVTKSSVFRATAMGSYNVPVFEDVAETQFGKKSDERTGKAAVNYYSYMARPNVYHRCIL